MADAQHPLAPVEQKEILFYEDTILAVRVHGDRRNEVFIPVRPLVEVLNLDWSGQLRRLRNDPVLADEVVPVRVDTAGGPQEMPCLPLDMLNGWLFGINANRVKDEVRERLIRYQRECYRVLAEAFLPAMPDEAALTPNQAALLQIREMGLAIVNMAEQQMALERRTTTTEQRLDQAAAFVGKLNRRLSILERRVAPGEALTEEQAFEIKERVTQVALEMARHEPNKSHFADVYRSLSLQTRRTSYKDISQDAYEHAVRFLDDWLDALRGRGEDGGGNEESS